MAKPASSSSTPLLPPPPDPTHHPHPNSSPSSSNPPSPKLKPKLEHTTATSSSLKKNPPLPWTHQETISLIQAYQEKWYSLKKGQLKANQWEEVAINVAAHCGYDEPSKSATQCRHKIEKLRKRYRAERVRPYPNSWQYFELMDRMERGPLPISAVKYPNTNSAADYSVSDSDEGDVDCGAADARKNKLKSINNIVRGDLGLSSNSNRNVSRIAMDRNFGGGGGSGGGGGGGSERFFRALGNPVNEKRKGFFENDESDEDEREDEEEEEELEEGEEEEGDGGKELAAEIRGFAERVMRVENKKIEMMQETEKCRMEMEKKRMEMILEAQRKIVDTIGRAFGVHKKVKMTQEF